MGSYPVPMTSMRVTFTEEVMRPIIAALAGITLMLAIPSRTLANIQWLPVSYEDLINGSDLIVVGKVTEVTADAHDEGATTCGTLEIQQVLAGDSPGDTVKLDFPSPVTTAGTDGTAPAVPTDVYYAAEQEGIWFLRKDEFSGCYRADHPARFKPIPLLSKVQAELERAVQ